MKYVFALCLLFSSAVTLAAEGMAVSSSLSKVTVKDAKVRLPPPGVKNTGMFMEITNSGSATLEIVKATGTVSNVVELHDHINVDGVLQMREIPKVVLKPGATTVLKPGSLHIMLIDLKQDLKEGQEVEVSLVFANQETLKVKAPVQKIQIPTKK